MKEDKPSAEVLIAPQLAVQRYLDELLQDATLQVDNIPDSEDEPPQEDLVALLNEDDSGEESKVEVPTEEEVQHQKQDALVAQEIENEEDIFAAFEFAVAALENESEQPLSEESELEVKSSAIPQENMNEEMSAQGEAELDSELSDTVSALSIQSKSKEEGVSQNTTDASVAQPEVLVKPDSVNKEDTAEDVELVAKLDKTKPLPWAQSRFECLLFNVGGLKMAVPLVELGGIQKADYEKVTKIFGQPEWFIGVSSVNDLRIRTVDTARWVMPNHYKGELHDSFKFVIQLDRSNWGLACEDVAEAISLEPSEVKWRSDRSKRPWLAGTVINHMCAILDVQGFIELLDDPVNGFKAHLK